MLGVRVNLQLRQPLDNLHRLQADGDDAEEEFEGVFGVAHGFGGPEVGVVGNAAVLVFADALAFHDSFEGGFAVDHILVGFQGDVANGAARHA